MKVCPDCSNEYDDDLTHCPHDGTPLQLPEWQNNPPTDLVGRKVAGRFEVKELLGAGGMGSVYLAIQEPVGRRIALKVLNDELNRDSESVSRFRREAKAASLLKNPHTVTLYDFGQDEDGLLFLAMELLEGETLSDRLKRVDRLEWQNVLEFARQITESLSEAHQAGIVHRDLKPDNIFITHNGSQRERLKVLDFGIARLLKSVEGTESLTQKGIIFGTPGYMSPEQAKGIEVDSRADLYALGVILYELLSGSPPFTSESIVMLLSQHITEEPEPLHEREPSVPKPVSDLVMRLLEKEPDARAQSAQELLVEIESLMRPLPLTQPTPTTETSQTDTASQEAAPSRSSWAMILVIVVLAAIAVVGSVLFTSSFQDQPQTPSEGPPRLPTQPASTTPGSPEGQTAELVDIELAATPSEARFWLDGELLGTSPYTIQREQSDTPHRLVVKAPGHATIERVLRFDRSRAVELALRPLPETTRDASVADAAQAPTKTKRPHRPVRIITEPP